MSENFEKQLKAVEEKYSSLIEKTVKEKEELEKEKMELMKNSEGSKKELVDLMGKMSKAKEKAEEKHQVLINKMGQEKKELKEKFEKDKKESIQRSEEEKENLKALIREMDEKNKKIIDKINQEKQELRELVKKMDKDRNETQLVNQELLTKMNTILNLPSVNAAIQNLQGADNYSEQPVTENSQHSDTTVTQGLHKTNGTTQASNTATESSDELDDDIVVIPDTSSYIDGPMLSSHVSINLSK